MKKKNLEKYYHNKTPGFLTQEATILSPTQRLLLFWPVGSLYNQFSLKQNNTLSIIWEIYTMYFVLFPNPNCVAQILFGVGPALILSSF